MNDRQDLRFKILEYLDKNGSSTGEILCSDFLSTAHHDLGTIKRTLIELIVKGYINESNVDWTTEKETKSVILKINTSSPASDAPEKNPRRLLNRSDIPEIRLYLTLEGKKFIIEWNNLKRTTRLTRYHIPINILFLVMGAALTLGIQLLNKEKGENNNKTTISAGSTTKEQPREKPSIQNNDTSLHLKDTLKK